MYVFFSIIITIQVLERKKTKQKKRKKKLARVDKTSVKRDIEIERTNQDG